MYTYINNPETRKERRIIWAATRSVLETIGQVKRRSGKKSRSHWNLFTRLARIFMFFLKLTPLFKKGYGNAKTIRVNEISLDFVNLPANFNGFTILHLSDLHIDSIPGFVMLLINKIRGLKFDICLLTGDYRKDNAGSFFHILKPLHVLSRYITVNEGAFAVLGNHDTYLMAQYEQQSGIRLLINESVEIERNGQKILISGTDDPFSFYSEQALHCLETRGYPFKIAMVHTPELAKHAAGNGYDLYLCGHTHGGQICLREGMPIISHQFEGKQYHTGLWQLGRMKGYTSRGAGVSGIPVRFNCPAEITLITLGKGE